MYYSLPWHTTKMVNTSINIYQFLLWCIFTFYILEILFKPTTKSFCLGIEKVYRKKHKVLAQINVLTLYLIRWLEVILLLLFFLMCHFFSFYVLISFSYFHKEIFCFGYVPFSKKIRNFRESSNLNFSMNLNKKNILYIL